MSQATDPVRAVLDMLTRAANDRNAGALRWPVLASAHDDRGADARMLVLRRFDRQTRILELHTDARAPKIAQLKTDPRCTLVFFDARSNVQLRVFGEAAVHMNDAHGDAAFERAPAGSLDQYRGARPGARLSDDPERSQDARYNFAAIRVRMLEADRLNLSRSGHERHRVDFSGPEPDAVVVEP